jgi:exopolysaccharide biosynthesis polyprenyl glycosylphosphotransferase
MSVLTTSRTSHDPGSDSSKTLPRVGGLEVREPLPEAARSSTSARPEPQEVRPLAASSRLTAWSAGLPRFGLLLFVGDVTAFLTTFVFVTSFTRGHLLQFILLVLAYVWLGLYTSRLSMSVLDDLPRLAGGSVIAVTVSVTVAVIKGEGRADYQMLARAALLTLGVVIVRAAGYALMRHLRRLGITSRRAVIIGADQVGLTLAHRLQDHPEHGLRVVGFIDSDPPSTGLPLSAPLLGGQDSFARILQRQKAHVAILAFVHEREADLAAQLRECAGIGVELFFVPRFLQIHGHNHRVDMVRGIPLARIRHAPFHSLGWPLKRIVDVVIASIATIIMAPLMLLVALAVRLETGPGVLFRQVRVGRDGHPFTCYKFRSLKPAGEKESQELWNVANDSRMGPVGRFIRAWSIDELPQLFNILRGDMSIVGPRPERPHFVSKFADEYPGYHDRHRVPVGLTGFAAVNGLRGDTSIAERVEFDNLYIETWSLWLDVKIVIRTFAAVFRRTGS